MLIKDIKPIEKRGVKLLENKDAEVLIDEIIELPLRNACKIFTEKGIETLMSSANKNNIVAEGEKTIEKQDVYGNGQQFLKERPTYEDAGKGYAWIMLNFDTLSDDNKDWLFSLEERKGKNDEKIGEKAIWFTHPCEISKGIKFDKRLAEFEKRHIVLAYHWAMYSLNTVFLRMPINEQTTVEEVDEYFSKLAESFKDQKRDIEVDISDEER